MEEETIEITRVHTYLNYLMQVNGIKNDKALAKELGLKQGALSSRLKGNLSMDTLKRLSTLFGVSVKDFLR
jgi:hypothetical protein